MSPCEEYRSRATIFRRWGPRLSIAVWALIASSCGALHVVYTGDDAGGVDADAWADADSDAMPAPAGMIVLGGWSMASEELTDGAIYSPTTDTWSRPPGLSSGLIGGRAYHSAVWTGSSLIIWGGSSGVRYFDDGAVYTPATDTWTTPPGLNASPLSPRRNHMAVWTGTSMIVWGGYGHTGGDRRDGAIYSLEDDAWVAPPGLNASPLDARRGAVAVWNGREMIVWGGTGYVEEDDSWTTYSDGAFYLPNDDVWHQTPGLWYGPAVPSARFTPAVAWTESVMILWGGWDTTSASDGAIYDVAMDSWRQPPGLGAGRSPLAARSYPEAVWTGTETIIWGGNDEGLIFGDGAVYDVVGDSWSTPAGLGAGVAPGPRRGHTATWMH